jgi:hypothetical protein
MNLEARHMTSRELNALRHEIERHDFLWIVEDIESDAGLGVHDRRPSHRVNADHHSMITRDAVTASDQERRRGSTYKLGQRLSFIVEAKAARFKSLGRFD